MNVGDLEYAHVLPTKSNKKSVVLVKFRNRFAKYDVYDNRFNLKGTGVAVTEHLTSANLQLLSDTKKAIGFSNVWTSQTKILANFEGEISHVKNSQDIAELKRKFMEKFPDTRPDDYSAPRKEKSPRRSRKPLRSWATNEVDSSRANNPPCATVQSSNTSTTATVQSNNTDYDAAYPALGDNASLKADLKVSDENAQINAGSSSSAAAQTT